MGGSLGPVPPGTLLQVQVSEATAGPRALELLRSVVWSERRLFFPRGKEGAQGTLCLWKVGVQGAPGWQGLGSWDLS